jgi:predicted RNase H-like HicB family nuclease
MAAMSGKTYRVVVTREGANWLADVPDLEGAHTHARTLPGLDHSVREVIALVEDLPEGAETEEDLQLVYDVRTGDPKVDREAAELRAERERLRREERTLTERTERLARELRTDWSVRDCAHLLGVSMQRVSQIAPEGRPAGRQRGTGKAA